MKKHRVAAGSRKPVTRTAGVKNIMFFIDETDDNPGFGAEHRLNNYCAFSA